MAVIGFAFFYFVFLKIYCGIVFYTGISLFGSAVSAIIILMIEFVPALYFRRALVGSQFEYLSGQPAGSERLRLWLVYLAVIPVMTVAVVLVSLGFSENFYEREIQGSYRNFLGLDWKNVFLLGLGIFLMTLPAMVMTHIGLRSVGRGEF